MEKQTEANEGLVAYCGLYCGACGAYQKGKCKGCKKNKSANKWCKIRICCIESCCDNCAACKLYTNSSDCKKLNNSISKVFSLLFRSDRNACIKRIKETGSANYAKEMAVENKMSVKKGR